MTPETAKQKIQALLDLGTLKGVKVEYEDRYKTPTIFYQFHYGKIFLTYLQENETVEIVGKIPDKYSYEGIKFIESIPLEPKLLEVGTRVKIVDGDLEGKVGIVNGHREFTDYVIHLGGEWRVFISIYHVIPESLLVEEEKVEFVNVNLPLNTPIILERHGEDIGYKLVKE